MKTYLKTIFGVFASHWKRTLSYLLILALLSCTVGLLADHFLTTDTPIDPISVAIVNEDSSPLTGIAINMLIPMSEDTKQLRLKSLTLEEAKLEMQEGKLAAYFVLPEGFLDSVLVGENMPIQGWYNPNLPLQAGIMQMLMKEGLLILEQSQMGIYSALAYTKEHAPKKYDVVFDSINQRYLQTVLFFDSFVAATPISFTGDSPIFLHYLFAGLVFLLLLSCLLFLPLFHQNFTPFILHRVQTAKKQNVFLLGLFTGWWSWTNMLTLFIVVGIMLLASLLSLGVSLWLVPAFLLLAAFVSAFGLLLSLLVVSDSVGILLSTLFAVFGLFFSGGILPLSFLTPSLQALAPLFPSYWAVQLLGQTSQGVFTPVPWLALCLFTLLCLLLSFGLLHRKKEVLL